MQSALLLDHAQGQSTCEICAQNDCFQAPRPTVRQTHGPPFYSELRNMTRKQLSSAARKSNSLCLSAFKLFETFFATYHLIFWSWISNASSLVCTGSGVAVSPPSTRSTLASWSRFQSRWNSRDSNSTKRLRSTRYSQKTSLVFQLFNVSTFQTTVSFYLSRIHER